MSQWCRRQQLMACLLLSEPLWIEFRQWRNRLSKPEVEDHGFQVWTDAIEVYYAQWNKLPDLGTLQVIASPEVQRCTPEQQVAVQRDAGAASSLSEAWSGTVDPREILTQGQLMLAEYIKGRVARRTSDWLQNQPEKAIETVESMRAAYSQLDGMLGARFRSQFPDGDFPPQPEDAYQPVGLAFVNTLCGGGLINGEVVGHAAPIGQGKTTLLMQLVWDRAAAAYRKAVARATVLNQEIDWATVPRVYFFAYEKVETLLANYISNAAHIPRGRAMQAMLKGKRNAGFSSVAKRDYQVYEQAMYGKQLEAAQRGDQEWPAGELERFERVTQITDRLIRLVDFSGHDATLREWSCKSVAGMSSYLQAHQELEGKPGVNFVALDFIGAMVDTAIGAGTLRQDNHTQEIRMAPNLLSRDIGSVYSCPVWAAHQLNPDENSRRGGTAPDPKAGAGSRMFLEYCSVGFASGVLSRDNIAVYVLGKQRRLQTSAADMYLGRLCSQFARWERANDFVFQNGVIMPKRDVAGGMAPPGSVRRVAPIGGFGERLS